MENVLFPLKYCSNDYINPKWWAQSLLLWHQFFLLLSWDTLIFLPLLLEVVVRESSPEYFYVLRCWFTNLFSCQYNYRYRIEGKLLVLVLMQVCTTRCRTCYIRPSEQVKKIQEASLE